ncbi:hypothetical protein [Persicirhabdus sediminis]|uniref:CD-NTase-associated protein 15 domain-containing protein n=1 Tax=Persicirhabdus sediminis TaxID=454144 RepID=A0A8J7MFH7_9BACT|nr:hypothetical protein [Persicirhabdus sediminis]MBK1791353.1 hypothetical protein [Persicirhabdus sediminis]
MNINFRYYKSGPLVSLIALTWAGLALILKRYAWDNDILLGIGPSVGVGLLLWLYDNYLWNIPWLDKLNTVPDLNGTYIGNIQFNRTGTRESRECSLFIKQTCSKIKVTTAFPKKETEEPPTKSTSLEAFISTDEVGDHSLYFYYHNPGSCLNGDTLNPHDGMNVLHIDQTDTLTTLDGYYFTNRDPQTKGCMTATKQTS